MPPESSETDYRTVAQCNRVSKIDHITDQANFSSTILGNRPRSIRPKMAK
uniref:Uncharacterized protein n=1 Tax=Rhizophora mucronata TaxID=61149 RepID=A0A2P2NWF2_RHIMU